MRFLHERFEWNSLLISLRRNDAGATAIEYGLIAALIAVAEPDERVQHGRVGSLGDRTRRRGKAQCG